MAMAGVADEAAVAANEYVCCHGYDENDGGNNGDDENGVPVALAAGAATVRLLHRFSVQPFLRVQTASRPLISIQ
jgi:hypothetical protein